MSKLYRVKLKGMTSSIAGGTAFGHPYVVADNPTDALEKVQKYLNDKDLGFLHEREMNSIELLADSAAYSDCQIQLFL